MLEEGVLAEVGEGFCLSFVTQRPRLLVLHHHSRMLAVALQRERVLVETLKTRRDVWHHIMSRGWGRCRFAMSLGGQLEIFDGEQ